MMKYRLPLAVVFTTPEAEPELGGPIAIAPTPVKTGLPLSVSFEWQYFNQKLGLIPPQSKTYSSFAPPNRFRGSNKCIMCVVTTRWSVDTTDHTHSAMQKLAHVGSLAPGKYHLSLTCLQWYQIA